MSSIPRDDLVTCLVCGNTFQQINYHHLKGHGLSFSDYKAMFPDATLVNHALRTRNRMIRTGSVVRCEVCDSPFYARPVEIRKGKARFCSYRCHGIASSTHINRLPRPTGSNHPLWRGGRQYYYGPNWTRQQRLARKRDNFTCQMCGKAERDNARRKLDVHHIRDFRDFGLERFQEANQLSNLVTFCISCHSRVTNGIATWPLS